MAKAKSLQEFLTKNSVADISKEVTISERLKDWKFKIRAMTGEEHSKYNKDAMNITGKGKRAKAEFDVAKFNNAVIINHCMEPNFRDADMMAQTNSVTPEILLNSVLNAGEISYLADQITVLSGFDQTFEEAIAEAKD